MLRTRVLPFLLSGLYAGLLAAPISASTFDEAKAALERQDYELAAERYLVLTAENPEWAPGWVTLGQCYYFLGEPEKGREAIEKGKGLDPLVNLFPAYMSVGQALYSNKHYAKAVFALERAAEHAPADRAVSVGLTLGYAQYLAKLYQPARETLDRYIERSGFDEEPVFYLALACQRIQDYPCALENLRRLQASGVSAARASKVNKYLAEWSRYWALAPHNESRRDALLADAVGDTLAWFEAEPGNSDAVRSYGKTLLAAERPDDLIAALVPIVSTHPEQCTARTLLAKANNAMKRSSEAERWAAEAVGCDPDDAEAHVELGVAHSAQLRTEHTTIEDVHRDQALASSALASIKRGIQLSEAAGKRATELQGQLRKALARLDQVEAEIAEHEENHRRELADATWVEIAHRCKTLYWARRDDSRAVSPEDEAYYRKHDCDKFARTSRIGR